MSSSKPSPDLRLYEKLLMLFPGYKGYKEKELIRETDRVVRDELYRKLKKSVSDLRGFYSLVVSSSGSTPVSDRVEKLIYRLDSLAEKTRHAPYGYKPLFHAFKIDENVLDKILEHDLNMGVTVEELNKTTSNKPSSILEAEKFLADVEKLVEKYESLLEERDRVLSGIVG
ncbi:hypothetical protein [Thermosphaera sp.]